MMFYLQMTSDQTRRQEIKKAAFLYCVYLWCKILLTVIVNNLRKYTPELKMEYKIKARTQSQ